MGLILVPHRHHSLKPLPTYPYRKCGAAKINIPIIGKHLLKNPHYMAHDKNWCWNFTPGLFLKRLVSNRITTLPAVHPSRFLLDVCLFSITVQFYQFSKIIPSGVLENYGLRGFAILRSWVLWITCTATFTIIRCFRLSFTASTAVACTGGNCVH